MYYTKAHNESYNGPFPRYLTHAIQLFRENVVARLRAVGKTVSDLTDLRVELQTFRFRDERVTARSTGSIEELEIH